MTLELNRQVVYALLGVVLVGGVLAIVFYQKKKKDLDLSAFDSPDLPGSGKRMDPEFIRMLERVKKKAGLSSFKINSGYRTKSHNRKVGGVASSAHLTGNAADIHTASRAEQLRLTKAAREVGYKRMGIGKTFVHLDNDRGKRQFVAWGYPSGARPPFNPFA